ncbi:MAG: four helix bundle protein [Melioribacteraceae bacterium]|nr:four helix bundle protein [Melioribacteraceae bacterium]
MKFERFEDICGWQKAKELTTETYRIFRDSGDFAFKDQICRASVSVIKIAEGY